jgi:hypothetical protein
VGGAKSDFKAFCRLLHRPFSPPLPNATELSGAALWPMGRGWLSAQGGHIPFGLKEGCARCTTSSRLGSEEKKH